MGLLVEYERSTCSVQRCHGEHGFVIRLFNFLFGDDELDLVPPFRLTGAERQKQERDDVREQMPAPFKLRFKPVRATGGRSRPPESPEVWSGPGRLPARPRQA